MDMDGIAPPTVEAIRRASLLSSFLLENSICFGVNDIIIFQK